MKFICATIFLFAYLALAFGQWPPSVVSVNPSSLPGNTGGQLTVVGTGFEGNYDSFQASIYPANYQDGNAVECLGITRIDTNTFTCNVGPHSSGNNPAATYFFFVTIEMVGGWTYGETGFFTYTFPGTLAPTPKPTSKPTPTPTSAPIIPTITHVSPNSLPRANGGKITVTGTNLMHSDYYLFYTCEPFSCWAMGSTTAVLCTNKIMLSGSQITCNVSAEPAGNGPLYGYSFGAFNGNSFYPDPSNIWVSFFNYV